MEEKKNKEEKITKLVEEIGKLTLLELSQLVKAMEEKFGIQPAAVAAPAAPSQQAGEQQPAEEKTSFTVVLTEAGNNKIAVIKALREIKPELGLKEAKDMTEQLPAEVVAGVKKEVAEEAKKKLEEAGAKVEIR